MFDFMGLPTELRAAIIQWLPPPGLFAISLAHSSLHRIAEGVLYSNIRFTWTQESTDEGEEEHCPPIMHLLRTILERPDIGREIRSFDLQGDSWWNSDVSSRPMARKLGKCPELPTDKLSAAIKSTGISQEIAESWASETRDGNSDAVVALIVAMSPHIMRLSLSRNWSIDYRFLSLMFKAALCNPLVSLSGELPKFEHLVSVSLAFEYFEWYAYDTPDQDDILALFYLPHIQHLTLPIASRFNMSWPGTSPPNPLSLASLEVERLRENHLAAVLTVCKNLKRFTYSVVYHAGVDKPLNHSVVNVDWIAAVLAHHFRDTLTDLCLSVHASMAGDDIEEPPVTVTGSLRPIRQLHHLKRMTIPVPLALGRKGNPTHDWIRLIVPPGVEYLSLRDELIWQDEYSWLLEDKLENIRNELSVECLASMPNLRGIRIEFAELGHGENWKEDVELEAVALEMERLRVDFNVHEDQPDGSIYIEIQPKSL